MPDSVSPAATVCVPPPGMFVSVWPGDILFGSPPMVPLFASSRFDYGASVVSLAFGACGEIAGCSGFHCDDMLAASRARSCRISMHR